ncbi:MAG: phosphatase PAP2 family protein [Acidovorax sp.]|uniref:phosphatase PAP2 family protein n=1 Tax=Acidovorax sp. TaxID=1872122 RepID=UPI0025B97A44|nr:phosphatase PAP2 family protein [Acidovorax sp.]MCE1193724.1 phosphatase PAP2 family protein [Acidovorax sp.]
MLPLDVAVFHALNADATTWPGVVAAARWASQQLPIAMGGALVGCLVVGNAAQRHAVARVLASMALAWLGVQLLRYAVPAPRPAQLGLGVQWIEHSARAGFPSMHAAGAFALAASLQASRPARSIALAGWAGAFAVAWSRLCLGVHFPSDVLVGMLTGALSAGVVHALSLRWAGAEPLLPPRAADAHPEPLQPAAPSVSWPRKF